MRTHQISPHLKCQLSYFTLCLNISFIWRFVSPHFSSFICCLFFVSSVVPVIFHKKNTFPPHRGNFAGICEQICYDFSILVWLVCISVTVQTGLHRRVPLCSANALKTERPYEGNKVYLYLFLTLEIVLFGSNNAVFLLWWSCSNLSLRCWPCVLSRLTPSDQFHSVLTNIGGSFWNFLNCCF